MTKKQKRTRAMGFLQMASTLGMIAALNADTNEDRDAAAGDLAKQMRNRRLGIETSGKAPEATPDQKARRAAKRERRRAKLARLHGGGA